MRSDHMADLIDEAELELAKHAAFPHILYSILEKRDQYGTYVVWTSDHAFLIRNPDKFSSDSELGEDLSLVLRLLRHGTPATTANPSHSSMRTQYTHTVLPKLFGHGYA